MVVLHIHPHDPVAPLAFGVAGASPVIFLNHADHAFTIGMSATDLIADLREAGQKLGRERRNVTQSCLLPIPLNLPPERRIRSLPSRL